MRFPFYVLQEQAGDNGGASGGADQNPPTPKPDAGQEPPKAPEMVSKAELEKVLAELHKHKNKAKALGDQIENEKLNRMKEQNQWKEIAEAKEREAQEAKQSAERLQQSFISEKKFSALRDKCAALGLRPEAVSDLEMLDLSGLVVETTNTGRIEILGADKFATQLKTLKPHWFQDKTVTTVNTNGTRVLDPTGPITTRMILDAEKEGKKSGDMSKYYDLTKKYLAQRAGQK